MCGSAGVHEERPGQATSERVVGAEDSSILEMPVLRDDHLEYQHQWSGANQNLEASYLLQGSSLGGNSSADWEPGIGQAWTMPSGLFIFMVLTRDYGASS